MNPNSSIHGNLGSAALHLNTADGVLTLDSREIVLMRVKLIAQLLSDITERPMFSGLLHNAGKMMGEDFAVDWLLMKTPITGGNLSLPPDVQQYAAQYTQLEDQIDRGSLDPIVLAAEKRTANAIREGLRHWLGTLPDATLHHVWQGMMDLDIYGGWGRARLVEFRRADLYARIEIAASFIARPAHIWNQHGLAKQHVCHLLAGYLEGEASLLFASEDIACTEQQCRLEGGDVCSFVVQQVSSMMRGDHQ